MIKCWSFSKRKERCSDIKCDRNQLLLLYGLKTLTLEDKFCLVYNYFTITALVLNNVTKRVLYHILHVLL